MGNQNDMALFLAVVDHGSFSAAGRALGQTPSAVGKRVRILEERLGVGLLIRSTRRMTLTQAGRRYSEEAREIIARIAALEDDIIESTGHLRGTIRLTSPTAFGQRFVVPAIIQFMQSNRDVEIELLMTDKVVDLVGEAFDLAIRTGKHEYSSLIGRTIMPYRRTICAAPGYIKHHGRPMAPADLSYARKLVTA